MKVDFTELTPIVEGEAFHKWGIDFVGPISPTAQNTQARFIFIATDYATKWAEARATKDVITKNHCTIFLRGYHYTLWLSN